MRVFEPGRSLQLVGLLALAAACGSASMSGGIAGTASVMGPISGFGSVIVTGIEFDTSNAVVVIDGSPAQASDLKLGMVTVVRGVVDGRRGVAERVTSDDLAQGPIDALDVSGATLGLLGQQVIVDAGTVFDPTPFESLEPDETVVVHGFFDANGRIRATRIERRVTNLEIEIKGYVQELDEAAQTFLLRGLTVDFGEALIQGTPTGRLENGLFVEIETETRPVGGVFSAVGVEVFDPSLMTEEGDGLKVEGFVTAILSATEVVVNGSQRVRVTPDTRFERGDQSKLVLDARVDVEGVADPDGVLIATEVEFL